MGKGQVAVQKEEIDKAFTYQREQENPFIHYPILRVHMSSCELDCLREQGPMWFYTRSAVCCFG